MEKDDRYYLNVSDKKLLEEIIYRLSKIQVVDSPVINAEDFAEVVSMVGSWSNAYGLINNE